MVVEFDRDGEKWKSAESLINGMIKQRAYRVEEKLNRIIVNL